MAIAFRCRALLPLLLIGYPTSLAIGAEEPQERNATPGSAAELFDPNARPGANNLPELPIPPRPNKPYVPQDENATTRPTSTGQDPFSSSVWLGSKPADINRRKLKNQSENEWGIFASEFIWRAPEAGYDSPFERGEWSTEDLFAIPVTGPLYLFTEVSLGGEFAADQFMKVIGKTGMLWKLPVGEGPAIELRGGPTLKYNDALRPEKSRDQAAMLWELKARSPLIGPLNLEYLAEALPGLTAEERGQFNQDVNLFIPISGGKVKFGAKHRWEPGMPELRASNTLMQLYLGVEIGR